MPESPAIPLQPATPRAGADLRLPVPIHVAAEIVMHDGQLHWAVLDWVPESQSERPLERRLRLWRINRAGTEALPLPERTCLFEAGHEASFAVGAGYCVAIVAHNQAVPAKLLRWNLAAGAADPWSAMERPPLVSNLSLPSPVAWAVTLEDRDRWSTAGIPPEEWVFNPRVKYEGGRILASLDTADGRTGLFTIDAASGVPKELALPKFRGVSPVLARHAERQLVLARGPDAAWSGYFDNPILSFRRGPITLPLVAGVVGGQAADCPILEDQIVGVTGVPAYAFDIATRPDGQQLFATVVGDRAAPTLLVYRGLDAPRGASIPLSFPLQGRVARLRVAATDTHVSICVVYVVNGQFLVEFRHRVLP